jgi:hypothetical protein
LMRCDHKNRKFIFTSICYLMKNFESLFHFKRKLFILIYEITEYHWEHWTCWWSRKSRKMPLCSKETAITSDKFEKCLLSFQFFIYLMNFI